MKKEIEKKTNNDLSDSISPFLSVSGNPKPKEKYKPSHARIKALELALEKKANEQNKNAD